MNTKSCLSLAIIALCLTSMSQLLAQESEDPHLWLEEIDGVKALSWVQKMNLRTQESLEQSALYKEIYSDALAALDNKDKLPDIEQIGNWIYQLHKNPEHARGLYQRTRLADFKRGRAEWQTVLDIDALSNKENIKWVYRDLDCLEPDYERCLLSLSPGGGDAQAVREFNLRTLSFVKDGFSLPKSKMSVNWIDQDHLFVGTEFGKGSMTDSGYPRITKIWKRGTLLSQAKTIFETQPTAVHLGGYRFHDEKDNLDIIIESLDYWNKQYYQYKDGNTTSLELPKFATLNDAINGEMVITLQKDWSYAGQDFKQGSVLLVPPAAVSAGTGKIKLLFEASPKAIVEAIKVNKSSVLITVLEDVKSRIYRFTQKDQKWQSEKIDLPPTGNLSVVASNDESGEFIVRYEDFVTPPTLYSVDSNLETDVITQQSATFDNKNLRVEQFFADSNDGTRVPYFVVMKNDTKFDGSNPTHIFAYGGFRAALTPAYSGSYEALNGVYGKAWLQRGAVFVLANIRGGGEYGPAWHAAALRENRVKAFEDFEAIAEDLFERKITSAKHLGIEGRSNGGLLVAATMIRRPELYGAVICGMPLADMQRYHKLLAGASWMAEYGDPDTEDWTFMKDYSPYQNLISESKYPPIYFFTSTRDDRVHPGHARKMAARMLEQGHSVEYYENIEGGHKGSVTNDQLARRVALGYAHLWRHLE